MVRCHKLGAELPGLKKPPFPNELGQWIYENLSQQAWEQWLRESVRIINTYRVDLGSPTGMDFMLQQLRIWLGLQEGQLAQTAWTPPRSSDEKNG
ncbi:MAG: oxidative damage protection protein [Myxococcota bacterium]|nr:oxidative damage protection protein [Myxococcota bacterium]